ncbi:hypothetical protein BGW80DRAFT_747365 [Lactifluus volemus]|nr:hypothetical protein BGW80DRAFT_747365 [Lactifluus volemus]
MSSSLFSEEDKKRRVIICAKATDAARLSHTTVSTLASVFRYGVDLLQSVDIWQSLSTSAGQVPGLCSQGIIAGVITSVSERDERWRALANNQLGVSEAVFRNYLANGDSVLLANFIHFTHPLFRLYLEDMTYPIALLAILRCISKFDIENTLPRLQHDFCALWNEITQEAHDRGSYDISHCILSPIRHLYFALHQGTDVAPTAFDAATYPLNPVLFEPSSYPLCNIPGHHTTGEANHPFTITSDPPDAFLNLSTEPAMSSFPASTERHSRVHFVGESSLHDVLDATVTIEPSHRPPPVNAETSHPAATSLDRITQGPTDRAPTISSTSNTELDPHLPPVVFSHLSFSLPSASSNIPDPQTNAGLGVVLDTHLSSPSGTDTPLPLPSPFAPSISLPPPQGTFFSHTDTAPNDGTSNTDYKPRAQTATNVEIPERSHESAISAPDIATDASWLRVSADTVSSSDGIDRPA